MKMMTSLLAAVLLPLAAWSYDSLKNGGIWYDTNGHPINAHGGSIVWVDGRYWWYGEHKVYGKAGNKAHVGFHAYSSDDLVNWRDEGVAFPVSEDILAETTDGSVLELPKVIYRPEVDQLVMLFHLEQRGHGYRDALTCIARANDPRDSFMLMHKTRPNGHFSRDMSVFTDDDGKHYHLYASTWNNRTMYIDELTEDCKDYTGVSHKVLVNEMAEAPMLLKRNGWYLLVCSGCSGWKPNTARLYRARNLAGPWERLGNPCKGGVNPFNGMGPEKTWGGQSCWFIPLYDRPGEFVALFDVWNPDNAIDGRYMMFPVDFTADGELEIRWRDEFVSPVRKTSCNPLQLPDIGRGMLEKKSGTSFREVADPTLLRHDGQWYLYPSCKQLWRSRDDGATWEYIDTGITNAVGYAPTVVQHDGGFLFMSRTADLWRSREPEGPFKYLGRIDLPSDTPPPDDPMLFSDDDGRLYCYWGCTATNGIYGCELDAKNPLKAVCDAKELTSFDPENRPWERHGEKPSTGWVGGAWMIRIGGKYHLVYSAGGTQFPGYAMGEYIGDGPLGPFKPSKAEPFFRSPEGVVSGTGHGSVVRDERGEYYVAYSVLVGNRHKYERRIGMDRIDVNYWGHLHATKASDVPQYLPKFGRGPAAYAVEVETEAKAAADNSLKSAYEPGKKSFTVNYRFSRTHSVCSTRVLWGGGEPALYRVELKGTDGIWRVAVNAEGPVTRDLMCDFREFCAQDAVEARLVVSGSRTGDEPPVLLEWTLFAADGKSADPKAVARKIIDQFLSTDPEGYCAEGFNAYSYGDGNYVSYSVVSLWVNALTFARESGDKELEKRLVELAEKYFPGGEKANKAPRARHVDFAVFGALPLEVYMLTGNEDAKKFGLEYADDQWDPPRERDLDDFLPSVRGHYVPVDRQRRLLADGYSGQTRLWIDDMYMINVLQTQAYRATKDLKYVRRAAKEMCLYLDQLQQPDGLFHHAQGIPFVWSRGDGWMAAGMPMILQYLPEDDPHFARILDGYRRMMATLRKYQREDGMWSQLVNDSGSWAESSGTAMFAYAFLSGVRQGWLDRDIYLPCALKAWNALVKRIDRFGNLHDVCVGTGAKNDRDWYLNRLRITGDPHGHAAMLWVVNELLKLDSSSVPTSGLPHAATRTERIRERFASSDRRHVFVAMHRGDCRNYPENSAQAIRSAIALGAEIVEVDVQRTKDGRFVLLHDETLDRTTDGTGRVGDYTLAELKRLRLRDRNGGATERLTDVRMISLEEALAIARGRILVNIDKFTHAPREILDAVIRAGAVRDVILKGAFTPEKAKEVFGPHWQMVERGELLFMPITSFLGPRRDKGASLLPLWLAERPLPAVFEMCFSGREERKRRVSQVCAAPGSPRVWVNTLTDILSAGCGEVDRYTVSARKATRLDQPELVWGSALEAGATVIQTDYAAELMVYLHRIGRRE